MSEEKTYKVRVVHKAFPYYKEVEDQFTGDTARQELLARRGEEIEVSEADYKRGMKFEALVDADEVVEEESTEEEVPDEIDVEEANVAEISAWIKKTKPSVPEVIELADDDAELAEKLLQAESHATGGEPRSTLVEGLTKIIRESE